MTIHPQQANQILYLTLHEQTPATRIGWWLRFTNIATSEELICRGVAVVDNPRYTRIMVSTASNNSSAGAVYIPNPGTWQLNVYWTDTWSGSYDPTRLVESCLMYVQNTATEPTAYTPQTSPYVVYYE